MLLTDLRLGLRSLRTSPGFTAAAVVTLGLAMTLSITVLAVVNAYLFTQLPYPAAARLYSVRYSTPGQEQPRGMETLDWASLDDAIEHPIAWDLDMFYVLGGENAESIPGAWVTRGFVRGLGIQPVMGRGFDDGAFAAGSANVAIISSRFWQTRFGGDPSVLGRPFTAYVSDRPEEAESFTIIGVLPETFWHLNTYTDILVPLRVATYPYLVRLRAGVTPDQAAARITALVRAGANAPQNWAAQVESTHDLYVARLRPVFRSVAAAAALVLLVGCANVGGLLLLRATRRQKEIAVRTALGASSGAIARMLAAEALVLGSMATALGLALTRLLLSSMAPAIQRQLGRTAPGGELSFALQPSVAIGAAIVGVVVVILCGLAPLATSLRSSVVTALQSATRSSTEGRRSRRLRASLIALEIAASLALLSGSMLMLRTVVSLLHADLGFQSERALVASITLRQSRYPDAESRLALYDRTLERLGEMSGVESVALTSTWPLQQPRLQSLDIDGPSGRLSVRAAVHAVTDDYFATLDIPMVAQRAFGRSDRMGSEPVAIVSETLARRLGSAGRAIGGRVLVPQDGEPGRPSPVARLIVGVVADVRQTAADEDQSDVYVPLRQVPERFAVALVRTAGAPEGWLAPLRLTFRDIDPDISLTRARALQSAVDEVRSQPQWLASLLIAFAAVATLVAIAGVYGMIAYAVRQREREIAVRIAVGADPRQIMRLFLREGGMVIAVGVALGSAGALAAGRLLESQLFGIGPADPMALATAGAAVAAGALCAVWWPARRAAATDPAIALRME